MKPLAFILGGVLILAAPLRGQQTQLLTENDQIKVELTKYTEPCAALFHPVLLGEPLDSPLPPGHASNPGPSGGIR